MTTDTTGLDMQARALLGECLDARGKHVWAQNVRDGQELEWYAPELHLLHQLLKLGRITAAAPELQAAKPQAEQQGAGDAIRAAFEAWAFSRAMPLDCHPVMREQYFSQLTEAAWEGWRAALASSQPEVK